MKKRRMPAEWEKQKAIMMAFPDSETDWDYILAEAQKQFIDIIRELTSEGVGVLLLCRKKSAIVSFFKNVDLSLVEFREVDYNDTWTRDYGPITIEESGEIKELDFGFNGWGLKFAADKDNLVNLHLRAGERYENNRDFVLEGGSIESDGKGTLMTTSRCLTSPNRNGGKDKSLLGKILKERLGADHILWVDYGFMEGDDTDSHIDTLARLAPNDTILYVRCEDEKDPQKDELDRMEEQLRTFRTREGKPFRLIALPLPSPIYDEDGQRLPATYANYLVTNEVVFVPTYRQLENDALAAEKIAEAFPGRRIRMVDCCCLIKQHGSLHCTTMQVY